MPASRRSLVIVLGVAAAVLIPAGLLVQTAVLGGRVARTERVVQDEPAQPEIPPLPPCGYGRERTAYRGYEDWQRTLLDTTYRLPRSYEPPDLVPISRLGLGTDEMLVRELVIDDLAALAAAAEEAGNPIDVTWAYRSFTTQRQVLETWTQQRGRDEALRIAARPGHSEHQLGTGLDFKTRGAPNVDVGWRSEPAGRWMRQHAWEFGFIETYPKDAEALTCYDHEPWHYRYFGRDVARQIRESGLTAREFLWRLQPHG
ncbi:MAG TPA: M15 family metallopeptidase [Actinomycetota bacterium]|nr:M15 family metallopeptidase [Actinomycetota bacterium]